MRRFLGATTLLAALLAVALPTQAQVGLTGGAARDFIKLNGDWEELGSPLVGIAYDVPLNDAGDKGLTFGLRASQDTDLIQDYTLEVWRVYPALEIFGGAEAVLLDQDIVGEYRLLGGVRGGFRFDALSVPFEVSAHWSVGAEDTQLSGVFFGIRDAVGGGSDDGE